jgi:hypothetical protein
MIYVTVKDNGTAIENFGLSAFYNSSLIATVQATLTAGEQATVILSWNTSSVKAGLYQISATAPLAGDVSPLDNTFTDGYAKVMTPVSPFTALALYIILFIVLLFFLLALLVILLLRRRKADESEVPEQVGFFMQIRCGTKTSLKNNERMVQQVWTSVQSHRIKSWEPISILRG